MSLRKVIDFVCRKWQNILLVLLSVFVVYSYVVNALYVRINEDSVFYIGASQLLMDGNVPFVDFLPGYTPLSFYLMCVPFWIFGDSYMCAIIVLYLIQFVNAYLIYKILLTQLKSKEWSWLSALLFLLYSLFLDGKYYLLEPFVLLFGLISIKLLLKETKRYLFLVGFLCFCSFWSKQYGLGFICLALFYEVIKHRFSRQTLTNTLLILSGFVVGGILFVGFLLFQGADPSRILTLSGSDYERDGISGLVQAYKFLTIVMPVWILALMVLLFNFRKLSNHRLLFLSIMGFLGFMLPFYVRFYYHYYILALPFLMFIVFLAPTFLSKRTWKKSFVGMVFLSTMIPICYVYSGDKDLNRVRLRVQQENVSDKLSALIPSGEKDVFVSQDLMYSVLLNHYTPPLIKKYGLSNGFVRKAEEVLDMCQHARYCVIGDGKYQGKDFAEVNAYLRDHFKNVTMEYDYDGSKKRCFVFVREK